MILRKPYAFFIKMFKPMHIVLSLLILYLITLNNNILEFFNEYLSSSTSVVGENLNNTLMNNLLYIIPIIVIAFSMIIMGIMFKKKKPILFYFVSIFAFIVVLVINFYTSNFLKILEDSIVAVKSVKLIHDLVLINIFIESLIFILYFVRGLGLNFKKFDFGSDVLKLELNESDREEFEVNINIDINDAKRKRKERLRKFKYIYIENKFIINLSIIGITLITFILVGLNIYNNYKNTKVEGNTYNVSSFSVGVNSTAILNKDYKGNLITDEDNYLVVVNIKAKSNFGTNRLDLNDFSLNIEKTKIKPVTKYSERLLDLGISYDYSLLTSNLMDYIIAYEVPEKYITSDMILSCNNMGSYVEIKLNPIKIQNNISEVSKVLGENLDFNDVIGEVDFKIDNYEIEDRFLINYNYCVKKDDCVASKEYLKPSINTNFKKTILKLKLEYSNNSNIKMDSFYDLLSKFGYISYNINNSWYTQRGNFEQITSKKTSTDNVEYIGINSEIKQAEFIKIVFDIRGSKYEYVLKG